MSVKAIAINVLLGVVIVGGFVLGFYAIVKTEQAIRACEQAGGTYLRDEGKCVKIQQIPIP